MTDDNEWVIVFYVDENGCSYVQEFLRGLDIKTQARFAWSIEQLRIRNIRAQEPLVRHLEGKLWELREESRKQHEYLPAFILLFLWSANCIRTWLSEEDTKDPSP